MAGIRILDTLVGRVQFSYLRRSNRFNSIKRTERMCTLECQFRAAALGLCYKFPDLWITGMKLLCGCRTRVLITSRSLESAAFCSSVHWNLLTPKIIRIERLSFWRDNERKPRILLLELRMGFIMTGWVGNIYSAEMSWSDVSTEVITSTDLFWNVKQWSPSGTTLRMEEQVPHTRCYLLPM